MNTLPELIAHARAEGLWLWCHYQDMWFSPAELERYNAAGKFRWGAQNFQLREPAELLDHANQRIAAAIRERDAVMARIDREMRGAVNAAARPIVDFGI